jgi:excisionase family DNA binding protein
MVHYSETNSAYLRKSQAAEYLNVCERSLTNLMRRRMIPFYRLSRGMCLFRRTDLDTALEAFRVKCAADLRGPSAGAKSGQASPQNGRGN